ncbi:metalloproteinase inhibitor 2-like [Festucalex cinctus]
MSWKNFVLPLVLLCLWALQTEGTYTCTCLPAHPQRMFCQADVVVIKAKVIGVMPFHLGEEKLIKYDIQQTRNLKGSKSFGVIYTPPSSAACGVTLTKGTEYLFMGKGLSDNILHIFKCDFYQPWDALSATQKKLLHSFYKKGCDCTIQSCLSYPCCMTSQTECLWTDHMFGTNDQTRNSACVKSRKGWCTWHRETAWRQGW